MDKAACDIQRIWRGFSVWKQHNERLKIVRQQWLDQCCDEDEELYEAERCEIECRENIARTTVVQQQQREFDPISCEVQRIRHLVSSTTLQRFSRVKLTHLHLQRIHAAIKIQATYRGYTARTEYQEEVKLYREAVELANQRFEADVSVLVLEEAHGRAHIQQQITQHQLTANLHSLLLQLQSTEDSGRQSVLEWSTQYWAEIQEQWQTQTNDIQCGAAVKVQTAFRAFNQRQKTDRLRQARLIRQHEHNQQQDKELLGWERSLLVNVESEVREEVSHWYQQGIAPMFSKYMQQLIVLKREEAALTVQKSWRGYTCRRYLSDLASIAQDEIHLRQQMMQAELVQSTALICVLVEAAESAFRQSYVQNQSDDWHTLLNDHNKQGTDIRQREIDSAVDTLFQTEIYSRVNLYMLEGVHWVQLKHKCSEDLQLLLNRRQAIANFAVLTAVFLKAHQYQCNNQSECEFMQQENMYRDHMITDEHGDRLCLEKRADWEKAFILNSSDTKRFEAAEAHVRTQITQERQHEISTLQEDAKKGLHWVSYRDDNARKLQNCGRVYLARKELGRRKFVQTKRREIHRDQQIAAVKIQANWRAKIQRKVFKAQYANFEERKLLINIQQIERRQIERDEEQCHQETQKSFNVYFAKNHRRQAERNTALRLSNAVLKIQQWYRTLRRLRAKFRAFAENIVEKQERTIREMLIGEQQWRMEQLSKEFHNTKDSIWRSQASDGSAMLIQKRFRGYSVRRRMPAFRSLLVDIDVYLKSEAVDRNILLREQGQAREDIVYMESDAKRSLMEELNKSAAQKQLELQLHLQKLKEEEMKAAAVQSKEEQQAQLEQEKQRKLIEFKDELNVIETMESLDRKSIVREREYSMATCRENLDSLIRTLLPPPKPLVSVRNNRRLGSSRFAGPNKILNASIGSGRNGSSGSCGGGIITPRTGELALPPLRNKSLNANSSGSGALAASYYSDGETNNTFSPAVPPLRQQSKTPPPLGSIGKLRQIGPSPSLKKSLHTSPMGAAASATPPSHTLVPRLAQL